METTSANINNILPPELLLGFFDLIYSESSIVEDLGNKRGHPLVSVMLVCRVWRDLVESSPRYWTVIDIGIRESYSPLPTAPDVERNADAQVSALELQLTRSGQLPLQIAIEPDFVMDFGAVVVSLRTHACRWQVLTLLDKPRKGVRRMIPGGLLASLLSSPLPSLISIQVHGLSTFFDVPEPLSVNAASLRSLTCTNHFITTLSPSLLTFLAIIGVYFSALDTPSSEAKLDMSHLLELHIEGCGVGPVLNALDAPNLAKLVVDTKDRSYPAPESLPSYPNMKELQWDDLGSDSTFTLLIHRCPSLTSFSSYVVGREGNVPLHLIDDPPTFLEEIHNDPGAKEGFWSSLEEVQLDVATCTEMMQLLDLIPSIRKIRVLRDPTSRGTDGERVEEKRLLEELRERVEVALWLEPWNNPKAPELELT